MDNLSSGCYKKRMRPLFHPSADDISVEGILHALSDPVRVRIFAEIAKADSPRTCTACIGVTDGGIAKSTLSQHFKVLREAGLIRSARKGVEMHNTPRSDEIDDRFPGLLAAVLAAHDVQASRQRRRRTKRAKKA